jgi:hypothetical protein
MGARAKVGYRRSTWFSPSSKIFDGREKIEQGERSPKK